MASEVPTGVKGRVYQIHVCALCSSDRIVSTEGDSWCDECKKWMSSEPIFVGFIPDNLVVRAAIEAALEETPDDS